MSRILGSIGAFRGLPCDGCQRQSKIAQFWQLKIVQFERWVAAPIRGVGGVGFDGAVGKRVAAATARSLAAATRLSIAGGRHRCRLGWRSQSDRHDATVVRGFFPGSRRVDENDRRLLPSRSHCGVCVRVYTTARYAHLRGGANRTQHCHRHSAGAQLGSPLGEAKHALDAGRRVNDLIYFDSQGADLDAEQHHQVHQPSSQATSGPHNPAAQVKRHPVGAVKRVFQEQLVDPPHQRQRLGAFALRFAADDTAAHLLATVPYVYIIAFHRHVEVTCRRNRHIRQTRRQEWDTST